MAAVTGASPPGVRKSINRGGGVKLNFNKTCVGCVRGAWQKLMDRSWLPHWADLAAMRTHPVLGRHFCG